MTAVAVSERETGRRYDLAPWLFTVAVFVSAALVFLVEPLIGRLLAPALGGSPAIWNASLAFFQAGLLAGYAYAHVLQRVPSVRRQMVIHLAVVAAAALVLPLKLSTLVGPPWLGAPAPWLLVVLTLSIGAPFAALSATAPLLQAWAARLRPTEHGPYRLYAASNLGSLLALLAYPTLVEPTIGLSEQGRDWSLAYGGFAVLLLALFLLRGRDGETQAAVPADAVSPPIPLKRRLTWLALSAAPSSLLVGVTAHISADVASAPFLWVVPLALYLVTFIVAFRVMKAEVPSWLPWAHLLFVAAALWLSAEPETPWPEQLFIQLGAFTLTALLCHHRLSADRPPADRLTEFYLWISLGGVIGGGFNAFVAPVLFNGVWEYPAVLALAALARPEAGKPLSSSQKLWFGAGLAWALPLIVPKLILPSMLVDALMLTPIAVAVMVRHRPKAVVALFLILAAASVMQNAGRYRESHRSFFGVLHLTEMRTSALGQMRMMVNGTTLHGTQALDPAKRCVLTSYYAKGTAIGSVFEVEQARARGLSIGTVGLGAGTVAAFVRPTDRLRFFEIDPMVARIALDPRYFSFVRGCAKGPVSVTLGDARQSLIRLAAKDRYDLLMIDAFSSDAVPAHLLTVEALKLYFDRLAPDGVLMLHLSNRNLELVGPAATAARRLGASVLTKSHYTDPKVSPYVEASGLVLIAAPDPHTLDRYRADKEWTIPPEGARAWTDDHVDVWGALVRRFRGE